MIYQILLYLLFPSLADAQLFGVTRAHCRKACEFNCEYQHHLEGIQQHYFADEMVRLQLKEAKYLYKCWSLLDDALTDVYSPELRRCALLELRQRIGRENYENGTMPPCVPVWRFTEVRP